MDLDDLVGEMTNQADKLKELNHSVLFDLGDDGKILLDATGGEIKITPSPESEDAETTLVLSSENLVKLMNGDLNPMVAFTLGKLKVFGSKGIALDVAKRLAQQKQPLTLIARGASELTAVARLSNEGIRPTAKSRP